jgi:hypothetical protein
LPPQPAMPPASYVDAIDATLFVTFIYFDAISTLSFAFRHAAAPASLFHFHFRFS